MFTVIIDDNSDDFGQCGWYVWSFDDCVKGKNIIWRIKNIDDDCTVDWIENIEDYSKCLPAREPPLCIFFSALCKCAMLRVITWQQVGVFFSALLLAAQCAMCEWTMCTVTKVLQ